MKSGYSTKSKPLVSILESDLGAKLERKAVGVDETISLKDSSSDQSDEERSVAEDPREDDCRADFEDIDEKPVNPAAVNFNSYHS